MTRWVLAAAILILLAGLAAAEPQPVDSDWQRSDGVPAEIETRVDAPPETATEQAEPETAERRADGMWLIYGAAIVGGLTAAAVLWLRRRRATR